MKALAFRLIMLCLPLCLTLLFIVGCDNQTPPDQGITEWAVTFNGDEFDAPKSAGLRCEGNDSVQISGGDIMITTYRDGIKTDATEVGRDVLTVTGGNITINAEDDGLQASQGDNVTGGSITVTALGKAVNCDGEVNISEHCLTEK